MLRHLLIVVECRRGAWAAVSSGLGLARRHGAKVTLALANPPLATVIVGMPGDPVVSNDAAALEVAREGAQLLERAREQAERLGVIVSAQAIDSPDVAGGVERLAHRVGAELIVVGCEPLNAVQRLLTGSLVPGLVTAASVPVMICRDQAPGEAVHRRKTAARARRGREAGNSAGSPTLPRP